jgi:hypothetical protein
MSNRTSPNRLSVTHLAFTCLVSVSIGVSADNDIQRTTDGHPDLSGTYDIATLTPTFRPARLGDKLTLTDEEAEAVAEYWKNSLEKDRAPSDPDRTAPPKGGTQFYIPEFEGAAGRVGGYNAFFIDLGDSNFKIDGKWRTSIVTSPTNGQMPALSDAGKQRIAKAGAFRHENTGEAWWIDMDSGPYDDPELRPLGERCLLGFGSTSGPPMLPVMYNNLNKIVQTEDLVMILVEMNHDARIVRMNDKHVPADVRKWMGDSVGHWEGDTLVVDTTNFRPQSGLGMASKDLHVLERFSRLDRDTLLYQFTVDDPTWAEPWSGEYPWPASDDQVYEYACHEGNYSLGGILRGARLLEKEARAGSVENAGS